MDDGCTGTFTFITPELRRFLGQHSEWFRRRELESDGFSSVVYSLPPCAANRLSRVLDLSQDETDAERAYGELCERLDAVAFYRDLPISYRWREPSLPLQLPDPERSDAGWSDQFSAKVSLALRVVHEIDKRVKGGVGRLLFLAAFRQARDALRDAWGALPDEQRPRLPLSKPLGLPCFLPGWELTPAPPAVVNFIAEFSGFCEHFALTGMATWELPDPQGPQWPAILPADRHEGQDTFATPFHFPLQYSDGLGQRTIERHAETAEARGVSDLGRWETYAALFDIDIFEAVITQRYQQHRRPVGFVRELENILADITGLELERIAKLRKVRNALKEGRRNSLDGWR